MSRSLRLPERVQPEHHVVIAPLKVAELDPPELNAATPGVTVWRDAAGEDVIFGLTTADWHWVHVSGAGSYRFPLSSSDLTISAEGMATPVASAETLVDSYYRTVVPMALHAYGFETLHGSAIAIGGGVVALCAPPRNGKSTIAFALGQRGHAVVADDSVVLDVTSGGRGIEVVPLPFELRLRHNSAKHFARPSKREVNVSEGSLRAGARAPLAAVVVLSQGAPALEVARLSPGAAFKALLAQSQTFGVDAAARKGAMIRAYMDLAASVPVYQLSYPAGLEHLGALCDEVERLAGGETVSAGPAVTNVGSR